MNEKKKLLVIINPISGVGKQRTVEKALADYLDHTIYDYEIEYTQYAHACADRVMRLSDGRLS